MVHLQLKFGTQLTSNSFRCKSSYAIRQFPLARLMLTASRPVLSSFGSTTRSPSGSADVFLEGQFRSTSPAEIAVSSSRLVRTISTLTVCPAHQIQSLKRSMRAATSNSQIEERQGLDADCAIGGPAALRITVFALQIAMACMSP